MTEGLDQRRLLPLSSPDIVRRVLASCPHHTSIFCERLVMAAAHQCPSDDSATSRRNFLHAAGAVAAAASVSPMILNASDKAGTKSPVLGTGEFQYEVVSHNWGEVPEHIQWGETHGVAVDEEGLVYIAHRSNALSRSTRSSSSIPAVNLFARSARSITQADTASTFAKKVGRSSSTFAQRERGSSPRRR